MSYEIATVGGLAAASFILIFISNSLDKDRFGVLRVMFTVLSLYFLTVNMQVISWLLEIQGGTLAEIADMFNVLYTVMLYATVFSLFIIIIVFLWGVFYDMNNAKKYKYHKDEGG